MKDSPQDVLDSYVKGNEVFSFLNKIKTVPNTPLRIVLLTKNYAKKMEDFLDLLKDAGITCELSSENDIHRLWELSLEDLEDAEDIQCPNCKTKFKTDIESKIPLKYYFLEFVDSDLMILVTNSKNNFEILEKKVNTLYPLISRIFYRAGELRLLLNTIASLPNIEVIGQECVVKRLYDDKKTVVTYEQDTVDGFYAFAKKDNSWVDSIEVLINPLGVFRFSRKGVIQYSCPFNFSGFYNTVIKTIYTELIFKRREQYKQKSRSLQDPKIKPLTIKMEKEYFLDQNNIQKLANRLNESHAYEVSVLYLSENLAHIEGYDYANGGGFDIYINNSSEVKIVPQTQLTAIAIEAIIIRVADLFEGNVQ